MDNELLNWYNQLNEDDLGTFTVPVISPEGGDVPQEQPEPEVEVPVVTKAPDVVEQKDKVNSLGTFVMAKRIQDLLVRVAGLDSPYEEDSEERQNLVDKIKALYLQLGENIGKL